MNLFQELRQRRVPQITSGYVVGSWGLVQFLTFLESRMVVSPNLVNFIGLTLLLLLPSVVTLVWVHGRPGKDTWGRTPKVVVAANLLVALTLLFFHFNGRDFGGVTQTIAIEDEHGDVTERVVPKTEFRRRVLVFYPEYEGSDEEIRTGETLAVLLSMDISQDVFVDVLMPLSMVGALHELGHGDGHGLERPMQRKLARDAHISHFVTSTLERRDGLWRLTTELHASESGKILAQRVHEVGDLFSLADATSLQLREDLGIPDRHLAESPDLPIAELTSTDLQAVRGHVQALLAATHFNDWEAAAIFLEDVLERDPHFTLAHFLHFAVRQTMGDAEGAAAAITAAMENLYRAPERLGFMIKAQYYFNVKQDTDKTLAVLNMWSKIYPDDVNAYEQLGVQYIVRQDLPRAIAAYEQILAIDPSRLQYLEQLANLHTQLGNLVKAEEYLQRYVAKYPARSEGYKDLADFYSQIGRLSDARDALAQAQLLEPEDLQLALGVIELDIKVGKFDESERALVELMAAAETAQDRLRISSWQVDLALRQGRPAEVIEKLDVMHEARLSIQNPMQANLIYSMTLPAISMAGRPEEALTRLAEIRAQILAPYDALTGVAQAWVYTDLGRLAEARTSLARGLEVVDSFKFEAVRPTIALVEGMIAEAEGDLTTAIQQYQKTVATAIVVQPIYRVKLARALRLDGQEDEAMIVLAEGLEINPAHPEYQLEQAHLEYERGNTAQAREHLSRALSAWTRAAPEYLPAQEARQLAAELGLP